MASLRRYSMVIYVTVRCTHIPAVGLRSMTGR
jgi:hypothetical protein